jgi:RNA polymerase sigma factor (sigma-70 family)
MAYLKMLFAGFRREHFGHFRGRAKFGCRSAPGGCRQPTHWRCPTAGTPSANVLDHESLRGRSLNRPFFATSAPLRLIATAFRVARFAGWITQGSDGRQRTVATTGWYDAIPLELSKVRTCSRLALRRLCRTLCCNAVSASRVTISNDLDLDVADCLARVRGQDQDAARSLVEYLYPTVIRIVRANLPRRAAEEDLAQDIFVKMFEKLEQFRGDVPVEHWVSRIAVNHCLNAIRAQKTRPEWRMADLSEDQAAAMEATAADHTHTPDPALLIGARELVEMLLEALSPQDRLLIRMLEIEELSVDEVRQRTGWSATLVRVRAFRARRRLNKRFRNLKTHGRL